MKKLVISSSLLIVVILAAAALLGYSQQNQITATCQPTGNFITVDHNRIHYIERIGGETPVVFLHGASSNSRDWQHSLFGHLSKQFHLIAIDRPGLGHSEREPGLTLENQVRLIHKVVMKLNLDQPILVAHSLAGAVGARLLVDYQGYYKGLVIIAGAIYPIGDGSSWYTRLAAMPLLGEIFRHAIIPAVAPFISSTFIENSFYPQKAPPEYFEQSCLGLLFSPDRFRANALDLNQIRPFLDESYPLYYQITAPVSLVYGDQDQVIYQFSHAGGFKHKVHHAKYIMLKNTGHLPHFSNQEIIEEELRRISVSAGSN